MNQINTGHILPDEDCRASSIRLDNEIRGRILELERQVTRLNAQLSAVNAENEMNRDRIKQVRSSLSWRITRPLRRARRLLGRRPGGNK